MTNFEDSLIAKLIYVSYMSFCISFCVVGGFRIYAENSFYEKLPQQTWAEIQNEFVINDKKCHTHFLFKGVNVPKWENRKMLIGRFVRCDNDALLY